MVFEEGPETSGPIVITVDGKIRGSRARQLGDQLEEIASRKETAGVRRRSARRSKRPIARVVLDKRSVISVDSVGIAAFEAALDRGVELALVVRRGFELDDGREARALAGGRLSVHLSLAEATREPAVAGV